MSTAQMLSGLSDRQREQFDREGYLVVEDVFDDATLQPVIDEITETITRRAEELVAAGELSSTFADADFEHQLAFISRETDKVALSIWNGGLSGPAIFDLIRNPSLLDVAEQFCGPEIIASSVYRIRPKIPNYGYGAVPWHQDSGYTEAYCDKELMLTVWLPLVEATEENGCMWVQPGVHKGDVFTHVNRPLLKYLEIPEGFLPDVEPVCVPVRKGGVLLLTNLTPHASFDNRSDIVRWSMDLRYQSASLPTNAPITRLPGEAVVSPQTPQVPPACYPPEADFLVRSRLRPDEVVTDPARFHEIRQRHLSQPVSYRWRDKV